jgi:hypothetical protein
VQSAALEALLHLAGIGDAALRSQAPLFLRPENQTQWKRVLGRQAIHSHAYCCHTTAGRSTVITCESLSSARTSALPRCIQEVFQRCRLCLRQGQ